MKNPLESLSTTVGLGVVLTAIMVLIIAIFYWDSGEATAPDTGEPPASEDGTVPPEDADDAGAAGDAGTPSLPTPSPSARFADGSAVVTPDEPVSGVGRAGTAEAGGSPGVGPPYGRSWAGCSPSHRARCGFGRRPGVSPSSIRRAAARARTT